MKKITRQELYKQVWSIPMRKLAGEYGISDVGLAKICRKYNIPRPPRGYWARIHAGQHLPKERLPRRSSNDLIVIDPNPVTALLSEVKQDMTEINDEFQGPPIAVSKTLRNPDQLVRESLALLESAKDDDNGLLKKPGRGCLDIQVSRKLLKRSLRIMDALLKAMASRGYEVYLEKGATWVHMQEEDLQFGIVEELDSRKIEPKRSSLDGYYQFGHSRFDYIRIPSGRLCLTIHEIRGYRVYSTRKNWRDTSKKKLEIQLDGFMKGLFKLIVQKRAHQRKKAEEERQRLEQQRKREEQARRLAERRQQIENEKQRIERLVDDAEGLYKSRLIRQFISAVESDSATGSLSYKPAADIDTWKQWANEQADRLDPLKTSPASILDTEPELEQEEADFNRPRSRSYW